MPPGRRSIPRPKVSRKGGRTDVEPPDVPPLVAKAAGELAALASRIHACEACDRASEQRAYGTGYPRAVVMLVGEQPSAADLEAAGSFTDEAEALDKAFDALGIPLSWVYGATAVRCGIQSPTSGQIEACSVHLLIEIEAVDPHVIVAFGSRAADAVRSLDGRCGISVPEELPQGQPVRVREGLHLLVTEPVPDGVREKDAKRRLWRDLQQVPALIGT